MAGLRVPYPQVSRSTRMPWRTIWARVRAKHPGPSRVQDRDGYSCRPHLCIALKWAHCGVWRLRPEEGADAAHNPSPAPVRRSFRSRDAPMPGSNRQPFCNPPRGLLRVHPKCAGQLQGALPISCRIVNFFRSDNCGQWNAISMRTSQVGQNDTVPRDIYVDVRGHVSPSYQRTGTWEWYVNRFESRPPREKWRSGRALRARAPLPPGSECDRRPMPRRGRPGT